MRVTANTFPNSLVEQLNRLAVRQYKLQNQAATGQKLSLPEDDPTAMRRVLDMQNEQSSVAQYRRNIERHQELATASFAAIKALKQVSDRAGEIAITADDLKSPEERTILADELNEMIRQAVQLVNSENRGDYIFAGTRSQQPAVTLVEDGNGFVTAVTYQGNAEVAESEIAERVILTTQAVGENLSGTGPRGLVADSRVGADFFGHLMALRDSLLSGDAAGIAAARTGLEADEENLIYHLGTNGAIQARLETTLSVHTNRGDSLEKLTSREADADLAQTLVRLSEVQTAYQAALQSGGTILSRSLLDFLR